MKSETREKITRSLLSFICFTGFLYLVAILAAEAFGTNVNHLLSG